MQTKTVKKRQNKNNTKKKKARIIGKEKKKNRYRKCKTENRIAWLRKDEKCRG